jgi:long-chain acyl-CoA synthetase
MATRPLSITAEAARGAALLAKRVEIALGEVDLTPPQYRLLALLEDGRSTATYAAERLAVSPPSVTAIVDGLVTRGLVTREHVEGDRRRVALHMTEAGLAALVRGDAAIAAKLEQLAVDSGAGDKTAAGEALGWWYDTIQSDYTSRATR